MRSPLEPVRAPDKKDPEGTDKPDDDEVAEPDEEFEPKPEKVEVKLADGSTRRIQYIADTTYWLNGQLVSAQQFMDYLFGDLKHLISGEAELREKWSDPELRQTLLEQLQERGFDRASLENMARLIDAPDSDIFDVLANIRFKLDPHTRRERVEDARGSGLSGFELPMRDFLEVVLKAYEKDGVEELAYDKLGDHLNIRYGSVGDAKLALGDIPKIRAAFVDMQRAIYRD